MSTLTPLNELFPARESVTQRGPSSVEDLGSQDFLALMVAQMENQDPTKPMDNMQFIAQLAQFGSVSGIQELNQSFADFASSVGSQQALQASSLVGHQVMTSTNLGELVPGVDDSSDNSLYLDATVDFGDSANGGSLFVQDLSGRLVYTAQLPAVSGQLPVRWDGRDSEGNLMPAGSYRISAEGLINGVSQTVPVYAHQQVMSVAIDGSTGQVSLGLANGEDLPINQIKQIF
ncbi:MAG: flagellar hook capping FlgD N-terminal domain-containing protein [Pseudomonadota bacterium]